jgi:hypothetical protein
MLPDISSDFGLFSKNASQFAGGHLGKLFGLKGENSMTGLSFAQPGATIGLSFDR